MILVTDICSCLDWVEGSEDRRSSCQGNEEGSGADRQCFFDLRDQIGDYHLTTAHDRHTTGQVNGDKCMQCRMKYGNLNHYNAGPHNFLLEEFIRQSEGKVIPTSKQLKQLQNVHIVAIQFARRIDNSL